MAKFDSVYKLEQSSEYKNLRTKIEKILYEQWNDFLLSGALNTFYSQYKKYFVNRRGKKIKIRKAAKEEDEVRSVDDVISEEKRTLQQDRLVLEEDVLNMKALLAFLAALILANMKSFGSYYSIKSDLKDYLKLTANRGGQTILDAFLPEGKYKFKVTNIVYKNKISERVNTLIKGLDEVTKKKLIRQLVLGIKYGETKSQLIKRVEKIGKDLAKSRAKRIVATETQAAYEFMRFEAARVNGAVKKIWKTSERENVCPTCKALDGQVLSIDYNFSSVVNEKETFGGKYPPAHPNCSCSVHYLFDNLCINYVKKNIGLRGLVEFVTKNIFYKPEKFNFQPKCVNPNAVWAGGEGLLGKDKAVGDYYQRIKQNDSSLWAVLAEQRWNNGDLTDEGYVQLRLKLGLTGKIISKDS